MFHIYSQTYPLEPNAIDIDTAAGLILRIPTLLPCNICANHALEYIKERKHLLGIITANRYNLSKFFVDFHNTVNKRLGKPQHVVKL